MLRTTHLVALQLSRNLASSRKVEVRVGGRRLIHCSMEPPTDSFGSGSKGLLLEGDDGIGCVGALVADTIPSVAETIHLHEKGQAASAAARLLESLTPRDKPKDAKD